ncbi:MAG TPA: hypothetical protein VLC49_09540 [Solirubrobacteraceae bacterium]|nr:hypothetical protein [Solirubrobacteraceae bacterium]
MDSARLSHTRDRLVRLRWRRAGAWLWPSFIAFTVADAVIGHSLPPAGSTESLTAAGLLGLVLNLLGVLFLSRPIGWGLRRIRRDLPGFVARDYGGTLVVLALTATLVLVGILHRPAMAASDHAMHDAIARAQAWIGDRAPAEFRRNLRVVSLFAIQSGTIYRACVPNVQNTKNYCVIVDRSKPLAQSVTFSGYEPNDTLASGTD